MTAYIWDTSQAGIDMGDYGFKVSRAGYPVLTATDEQLAFTSKSFLQKVLMQGSITVNCPPSTRTIGEVTHGLGYRPSYLAWVRDPYITGRPSTLAERANEECYSDTNKLYFNTFWNGGSNQDFVFYYYIFVDDGQ